MYECVFTFSLYKQTVYINEVKVLMKLIIFSIFIRAKHQWNIQDLQVPQIAPVGIFLQGHRVQMIKLVSSLLLAVCIPNVRMYKEHVKY